MKLTDIIDIQISRQTTAVARAAFNVLLYLATHTAFPERYREYTSTDAVAEDFPAGSAIYNRAAAAFSQPIRPARILIGRRQVDGIVGTINSVVNDSTYTITINDTEYTATSDTSATDEEIVAALASAYTLSPIPGIVFTDNEDGTFDVDVDIPGTAWSIKADPRITLTNKTPTETLVQAMEAVQAVTDIWYGLTTEAHGETDIKALAAAIEGKKKIYGISSQFTDIPTNATTDLFSDLKALGYFRTFGIYHSEADTYYPEVGLMAGQLQEQPGSNTWAYKTIVGTPVDNINDTASSNIISKNGMTYEEIGGVGSTTEGKMFGGEYVDVMVFVDWLESRMRERIWFRIRNARKVPFTGPGSVIIESEIRAQLQEGIRVGGLDDTPTPTVFIPDINDIAPNERAQRRLEGLTFEAKLAGAIHFVGIRGTVYA